MYKAVCPYCRKESVCDDDGWSSGCHHMQFGRRDGDIVEACFTKDYRRGCERRKARWITLSKESWRGGILDEIWCC